MKVKAEQCKEDGNKCMKEGKHTEAIIYYTEAIKHEPNSAILHSNRSFAFFKIDQLYLAMEDAQKAIKMDPNWAKGFYRKGEIEFKAGQYTKALMSYKQALILDPADEGIKAAIAKGNREMAKDKKDAARKPIVYTCLGIAVGVMLVAADQFLTKKSSIEYPFVQFLLVAGCGGLGFAASKVQRYLKVSQRESLLEEPIDLLQEMDGDTDGNKSKDRTTTTTTSSSPPPHKHHSQASGRQRMRKGKS